MQCDFVSDKRRWSWRMYFLLRLRIVRCRRDRGHRTPTQRARCNRKFRVRSGRAMRGDCCRKARAWPEKSVTVN